MDNHAWLKLNVACTAEVTVINVSMLRTSKNSLQKQNCTLLLRQQLHPILSPRSLEWSKGQYESLQTLTATVQHQQCPLPQQDRRTAPCTGLHMRLKQDLQKIPRQEMVTPRDALIRDNR